MISMQLVNPSSHSGSAPYTTHPLRVFLVEDSEAILERLTETISSLDHVEVVGHAGTEAEAIAALQTGVCDAIVLDLQLKEGNGFNVLKVLRSTPAGRHLVVLVFTNHATSQYRARTMKLGANYFFDKSQEHDQLYDVLERLAAGHDDSDLGT